MVLAQELSPEHMVRLAQCLEMHVDNAPSEGLRLLDALARHGACHIADFRPEQLAQLLCALRAVRHCDEALLAGATQRVLEKHASESSAESSFSTGELVDILWASVSLGRRPEGEQQSRLELGIWRWVGRDLFGSSTSCRP